MDWLHLSNTSSASVSNNGPGTSVAPPYNFGPDAQFTGNTAADGSAKFTIDNGNFLFGHFVNLGAHFQIEPVIGISAARLEENLTTTYTGSPLSGNPYSMTVYEDSKFTGLGPHLGLNTTYFLNDHFGIVMNMGGSLLAGSMKSTTNFDDFGSSNSTTAHTSMADQSLTRLVPELDGKLGLTYVMPLQSGAEFSLQAGYMFGTYINGINQVSPASVVPESFEQGMMAIETETQVQSDMDINGPYLNFAWTF